MTKQIEMETERLLLRRWQEVDLGPFINMNNDPEVMRYIYGVHDEVQTRKFYDTIQKEFAGYGYGLYAAEEKKSGDFIGFIGFHWARLDLDFCPCIEIGWRLAKRFWGKGYATEGAKACLEYGFESLGLDEVYSITAAANLPSQRVMQKIGLQLERCFDHPNIPEEDFRKPHVCYRGAKDAAVVLLTAVPEGKN